MSDTYLDSHVCSHGLSLDLDCRSCEDEERLGYDADFTDPSQFCRHGTFIGSWWGPDFLCHRCEMGE